MQHDLLRVFATLTTRPKHSLLTALCPSSSCVLIIFRLHQTARGDIAVDLVQAKPVAAQEWQLWWVSSPDANRSAKAVLQRLFVNPAADLSALPVLEPVPFTLTLDAEEVRLTLAVEEAISWGKSAELHAQDLAVIYFTKLQVHCSKPVSGV